MWLLSEIYESLPEVGDPRSQSSFFSLTRLTFSLTIQKVLLEKIEQMVRLIRSKGVGIFSVSQSPMDIPDSVLAQLGNKIQHGMRAYTRRSRKSRYRRLYEVRTRTPPMKPFLVWERGSCRFGSR